MSMHGGGQKLAGLTRELMRNWNETKDHWHDAKSREFEQRYLDELVAGVNTAIANIDRLERVMAKVRKDCE